MPGLFATAMVEKKQTRSRRHLRSARTNRANITNFSTQLSRLTISSNPFRNVPISSYLLLLTPYLHLCPEGIPSSPGIDPFETLGRGLTQFHSNIRHVPYVAGQGLIEMHKHLIEYAGGIIVVVCEPLSSEVNENERLDGIDDQIQFAEDASDLIEKTDVPGLLVTVGLSHEDRIRFSGDHLGVDNWSDLANAAEAVYRM